VNAAIARRPASPYARRLARERGLGLDLITGSGPGGRIVAADVEAFGASRAAAPVTGGAMASAFGVSVELGPLNQLLAGLAAAGNDLTLEVMLVRAVGRALEAVPVVPEASDPLVVALEIPDGGAITVDDPQHGSVSALHGRLGAPPGESAANNPPLLSVRCFRVAGIRAVAMPLRPGVPLRLVVSATTGDSVAECLFSFDAGRIAEETAAEILGRIRDDLARPLRLLA
jgi:pyruvate dehydrogenase E2 component (dihydrolipoamide acetyltransferase)